MSVEIRIGDECLASRTLGLGSVAEVLPRIARAERAAISPNASCLEPTHIELEAQHFEGAVNTDHFEIKSWHETSSDEFPGRVMAHSFGLELTRGSSSKPLDNIFLIGHRGKAYKLEPAEALFFLGLSFRAIAAHRSAKK